MKNPPEVVSLVKAYYLRGFYIVLRQTVILDVISPW